MNGPRIGELFAGYGGLGMGVMAVLGGDIAWVSEIDKGACKVLAHRYPDAPNVGDVTEVRWTPDCPSCGHELRAVNKTPGSDGYVYWCPACRGEFPVSIRPVGMPAPVDVVTAGFPCQDVSAAGKRAGLLHGTRSGLWHEVIRCAVVLRPPLLILENVRGLLSARGDESEELDAAERKVDRIDQAIRYLRGIRTRAHTRGSHDAARRIDAKTVRLLALRTRAVVARGRAERRVVRAIGTVVGSLADIGYDAIWCGLRAADVGCCHGRFRVFVAAYPQGNPWRINHRDGAPTSVAENLGHEWTGRAREGRIGPTDGRLVPTPTTRDHKGHNQRRDDTCLTGALLPTPRATDGTNGGPNQRGSSGDLMLPSAVAKLLPTPRTEPQREDEHARSLGVEVQLWSDYAAAITRWEHTLGRPAPDPTEPNPKTGRPRLSARFEEWMMGLPAGWITDVPDVTWQEAVRMCGNGVVPQQAEAAIRWLVATIGRLERAS